MIKPFFKTLTAIILCAVPAFSSAAWQEMEMIKYSDLRQNPVELTFTPSAEGILTVSEWTSNDPHLWTSPECLPSQYVEAIGGGYNRGTSNEAIFKYAVHPDQTYYCKAPESSTDDITAIQFNFEELSTEGIETITPGVPFKAYDQVMEFKATQTGLLGVTVSEYVHSLVGPTWSFLYTDLLHMNPVLTLDLDNPTYYLFPVEAGKTYYFYQNSSSNLTFTFEMDNNPVKVELTRINPEPGTVFDSVNFIGGCQVYFNPMRVNVGKATFSYTDTAGQEITLDVSTEMQGEAIGVLIYNAYKQALENAAPMSSCTITLQDVNYAGSPLSSSAVSGVVVENGSVSFSYIIDTPISIKDEIWPTVFEPYWPEGDPDGIALIEFTQDIAEVGGVIAMSGIHVYGTPPNENDSMDAYSIPFFYENNVLTIDFTGKRHEMTNTKEVTIMISGIFGVNGLHGTFDGYPVIQHYMPYSDIENGFVDLINMDPNAVYEVFDLNGTRVIEGNAKSLQNLKPGIYIINGHKILIK